MATIKEATLEKIGGQWVARDANKHAWALVHVPDYHQLGDRVWVRVHENAGDARIIPKPRGL